MYTDSVSLHVPGCRYTSAQKGLAGTLGISELMPLYGRMNPPGMQKADILALYGLRSECADLQQEFDTFIVIERTGGDWLGD